MRFAKEQGIPAQGRGSATSSIVSYTLGISRVEPIAHNLLFERFINPGRTTYPDVDIDFCSERREEVIQYVYNRYGPEHTGMVCNLVTYRARSAVREVGYALGFPRPLVDRVAKALETYDWVMVRRDLEADGGFAEFFRRPGEGLPAEDAATGAAEAAEALGFVDGMGQLNTRVPLVGKVPPWRQPPKPEDPNAPRPFAWLRERRASRGRPGRCRRPDRVTSGGIPSRERATGGARDVAAAVDPAGRPTRRRGRSGRHAGQRRLAAGRPRARATSADRDRLVAPPLIDGRRVDPESGQLEPPPRGRTGGQARPADALGPAGAAPGRRSCRPVSVARIEPEPPPQARGGSTVGLSDWERWLEFCARIDGFPRHLSIHSGGMLVTAAPLIDIAPLERATMLDRVVVQFDKRDVETLKLIKLDLLGLGMLAAMDETLQLIEHDCAVCLDLDRLPEDVPEVFEMLQAADTVGVFQVESRAQMQTLPKSRPQSLDDLVVEVAIIRPGPIQGNAVHPFLRRKQGLEPVTYLHPSLEPVLKDSMGVILYQEQVMRIAIEVGGVHAGRIGRLPAGDGDVALEPRDGEAPPAVPRRLPAPAGDDRGGRRGAVPPGRRVRELRVRQVARRGVRPDGLRIVVPQAVLPGPVPRRADQRPADGLLPGRGPGQRHEAPRRGGPAGRHQRLVLQDDDRVGRPAGRAAAGGAGIAARPEPIRSPACVVPSATARERWTPEVTAGWGVRLGPPPRQGDRRAARGAARRRAGARAVPEPRRRGRADRAARGGRSSG